MICFILLSLFFPIKGKLTNNPTVSFSTSIFLFSETIGLRVDTDEEFKGLDAMEHGISAYTIH
ncbi:ammonium transporter [Cellulosilyticum sp. ST5]|uniref:ammonium transporter n=1 Tax=unclassified Cellulosilyticum TaxID=2643091 RepID=UPI000F8E84F6|nr:ammonium transporter [Cellulosilyticum sp. WCF-2]QEH70387.1 ammonium transporter [Cellulosilyticum sp. WCF-2]